MILVTGSSGFLGSAVTDKLRTEALTIGRRLTPHPEATSIVCDLTDPEHLDDVVKQLRHYEITHIVHAAATTPWSTELNMSVDMALAKSVARLCSELKIPTLVFFSGWVVYDMATATPPFAETTRLTPDTGYGKNKLAVENYFKSTLDKTVPINLRIASVYGPGQRSAGLIPNLVRSGITENVLRITAQHTRRDYLYVDDLVQLVNDLIAKKVDNQLDLNVGSGQSVSVRTVAETILEVLSSGQGPKAVLEADSNVQESPILNNQLSISKAQEMGLLESLTPFRTGIVSYVDWVRNENIF